MPARPAISNAAAAIVERWMHAVLRQTSSDMKVSKTSTLNCIIL